MKTLKNRGIAFICAVVLPICLTLPTVAAVGEAELATSANKVAEYVYETVKSPQVGSIGGEWAVLGLARGEYEVPDDYFRSYYETVEEYVKACKGILHTKKYTEYSRVIVALSAIGKDSRNVAGYDLTTALGDYEKTVWQGLNGPIWALIALDSRDYPMPINGEAKVQATRQMYVDYILEKQLPDGGWNLTGVGSSDPDMTGMALQALAKYREREQVSAAIETALACVGAMQNPDGGFSSWGTENSESCVQIAVALCELGISLDDERFVKNGHTVLDKLMTYRTSNGFLHTVDGSGSNQMATEQGLYGLVAALRAEQGRNSLYRMSDAIEIGNSIVEKHGLDGKDPAVRVVPITAHGKTFDDISGENAHKNQPAIEALTARGIINGKTDTSFDPDAEMTRAEFAAIVVRALGLEPRSCEVFRDVKPDKWYAPYIGTAYGFGIVNGRSADEFDPDGRITREEAAVMTARAAKLCGIDISPNASAVRDVLAQFTDYTKTAEWSRQGLAVCYLSSILDQNDLEIKPQKRILRCEVAQMLYNLLATAKLL